MPHSTWSTLDVAWRVLIPTVAFAFGVVTTLAIKRSPRPLVKSLATKTIAEIAKIAATTAVHIGAPGSIVIAPVAGSISKDLVEALLSRTSEVERKLEALLREPLKAALRLLRDAAKNPTKTPEQIESRDSLLDASHSSFVRALALSGDSREDALFIGALDSIALAERSGRAEVAAVFLEELDVELADLRGRVEALQKEAAEWSEHVQAFNRFLGRGQEDWGGKPAGYDMQVLFAKRSEKQAKKAKAKADAGTFRFEMIQNVVTLAKASLKKAQEHLVNSDSGSGADENALKQSG